VGDQLAKRERIVVGVDGFEAGFGAVEVAGQLAAVAGASVVVVFVNEPPHLLGTASLSTSASEAAYRVSQRETSERCWSFAQLVLDVMGVNWVFEAVEGAAARQLAAAVDRHRACALVIGQEASHRHGRASTRTQVLDAVPVPVIIVPHVVSVSRRP